MAGLRFPSLSGNSEPRPARQAYDAALSIELERIELLLDDMKCVVTNDATRPQLDQHAALHGEHVLPCRQQQTIVRRWTLRALPQQNPMLLSQHLDRPRQLYERLQRGFRGALASELNFGLYFASVGQLQCQYQGPETESLNHQCPEHHTI